MWRRNGERGRTGSSYPVWVVRTRSRARSRVRSHVRCRARGGCPRVGVDISRAVWFPRSRRVRVTAKKARLGRKGKSESSSADELTSSEVIDSTRVWIERAVIGLNLCPFAKSVYISNRVRFVVSDASTADGLLGDLERELRALSRAAPEDVETTVLIHPHVLASFLDYNDFLDVADAAVDRLDLSGILQIASFHPDYRFAGTAQDDVTNYTNRSPYPMLHLLREESVERAVDAFPGAELIPERNMETMRRLGLRGVARPGYSEPE
jgi:hypothetical protein